MRKIVTSIAPCSPIFHTPIVVGSNILSLSGNEDFDIIDYLKLQSESRIEVVYTLPNDEKMRKVIVKKDEYEPLGMSFENFTIDKPRMCKNNCVFCFMAQMPGGMRETLTFKDDDYRLSFTDGNYITLTNVTDGELERIIHDKISPINISVHTTNVLLREKMMKNPDSKKINEQLKKLKNAHINFNAQIVMCPGYNDGEELKKTLEDMREYYPSLTSLSVVPVGLTRFREGLPNLKSVDREKAIETIEIIESFHEKNLKEFSTRLFYPSDEFFILAQREMPKAPYYEEFIQFENGVGMIASFLDDLEYVLEDTKANTAHGEATLVCATLAKDYYKRFVAMINEKFPNIKIHLEVIENNYFGKSITVTGLLCGCDIIKALKGKCLENLFIMDNMLDNTNTVFLDNTTTSDVQKELSVKIKVVPNNAQGFVAAFEELLESRK